ncbi:hypothetical protein ACXC9Q_12515 [Kribbella sp. CWNU-51]
MTDRGPEQIELLRDKYAMIGYLRDQGVREMADIDAIDISGAVLASPEWAAFAWSLERRPAIWRLMLLRPGSEGARIRAGESTVWRGNQELLEDAIRTRANQIRMLAKEVSAELEIRWYDGTPVSRYVRFDEHLFQSYYPADRTGQDLPLAILGSGSILGERARKEFTVRWSESAVA